MTLVGCWLMVVSTVGAAPMTIPFGWSEGSAAAEPARQRASAWAQAWGGEIEQVMSTPADDDYVETLAVIEVDAPLPSAVLDQPEAGPPWLRDRLGVAMGDSAQLDDGTVAVDERAAPGVAVLRGRGEVDDSVVMIAAGPRGPKTVVVVLQVARGEEILYSSVFDTAVSELDDLRAPLGPFPRGSMRLLAILAWLAAGVVVGLLWTRRSLPRPGARVAGRQVALALAGAAALVTIVARLVLGSSTTELALANTSPWGHALELALGGPVMALLVLAGTELWERRLTPVASAPQQGSFAVTGNVRRRGGEVAMASASPEAPPAVTGDTHVGPLPAVTGDTHVGPAPAVTGNTQVGPAPAVTGNTQVGPPPAVTGNTKVGPPPQHPGNHGDDPPVREIIAGAIEVDTQVGPRPTPSVTEDTAPRARRSVGALLREQLQRDDDEDEDEPASLVDAHDIHPALDGPVPATSSPHEADAPAPSTSRAAQSDLFPQVELERGPTASDSHPALDLPLPRRRR